ncbi:hypothetical protein M1446_03550 [Candidatus Dependentiae bacterium]|nr:hypothetical protein [Candidatus Dependentiae bacterium]
MFYKLNFFLVFNILFNSFIFAGNSNSFSSNKVVSSISNKMKEKFSSLKQHIKRNKGKYAIATSGLAVGAISYLFSDGETCLVCSKKHYRINTLSLNCCKKTIGKNCWDAHLQTLTLDNFFLKKMGVSWLSGTYQIYDYPCPNLVCKHNYQCKMFKTRQ